jgi:predicted nucleotidyltransferase component of viral defense system
MISRAEIEHQAAEFRVTIANIERDYVFGWLLAGIYSRPGYLRDLLVLKGGNGMRKAYFPYTRFSNDLDFSTQHAVDASKVISELNSVCDFVADHASVDFVKDRNFVREKRNSDDDRKIYEARLYFRDFYGNPNTITLSIRLDVSEFDRIYLPIQERNLLHLYSDAGRCRAVVRCLKLEEMLAAKLKCLLQRRIASDLYDYVYAIFINRELDVDTAQIVSTLLKKTIFEPSPGVLTGLLLGLPFQLFRAAWNEYVVTPSASLIDFDTAVEQFTVSVRQLFGRFTMTRQNVSYFPANFRNSIMQAASSFNLLGITYNGRRREVEPYSLVFKRRRDGFGQEYLYVWDRSGGHDSGPGIKTFLHERIQGIEVLPECFEPRYPVELAKAGEPGSRSYFGRPFAAGVSGRGGQRSHARHGTARVMYVIECSYCHRRFTRTAFRMTLKPHKDRYDNRCFGRAGHLVDRHYN